MHELKLVADILKEILRRSEGKKVEMVKIKLGNDSHVQFENIEFLFRKASQGTAAEGARLEISSVPGDDLVLESIRVE